MTADYIDGLPSPEQMHRALDELLGLAAREPALAAEMQRAKRDFFGPTGMDPAATAEGATEIEAVAEWRFAEWFLLERESDVLGDVPARRWLGAVERDAGTEIAVARSFRDALLGSTVGVFVVESRIEPSLRVRDLQSGALLEVSPPATLGAVPGDLLVGRLYGSDDGFTVSFAVALQPDGRALAMAFERDLAQSGVERRLSQADVEHLLFRERNLGAKPAVPPLERIEASLEAYFTGIGWSGEDVADISTTLRAVEDPQTVIGPLMDRVAFDTDGDLEELRRLLLALYEHRVQPSAPAAADQSPGPSRESTEMDRPAPAPGQRSNETLGQFLARRIDAGLDAHENIDDLFGDVAELMGEPRDAFDDQTPDVDAATAIGEAAERRMQASMAEADEPDPTGGDGAEGGPEQPSAGDLDALVEEYLWEAELGGAPAEAVLREFEQQQRELPVPRVIVEDIPVEDLLRFLLQVYLSSPPTARADAVLGAHRELGAFYSWLDATQEFDVAKIHAETGPAFVEQVERCAGASELLSDATRPTPDAPRPVLMRLLAIDAEAPPALELQPLSAAGGADPALRGASGTVFTTIPAAAVSSLRVEDLVLGGLRSVDGGESTLGGMVIVLPATSEQLLG